MRERWWGASGRRVPELAIEGDAAVPVAEALVLDGADDLERARRGVRARAPRSSSAPSSPEQIKAALARPEVAAVLVPADRTELLDVDLTELTYG